MLFFGKKRKKEQEIDEAFAKVYQEIETIDNWNDPKKLNTTFWIPASRSLP